MRLCREIFPCCNFQQRMYFSICALEGELSNPAVLPFALGSLVKTFDGCLTTAAHRDVKAVWKWQSKWHKALLHIIKCVCFFLLFILCLLNDQFQSNVSVNLINSQPGYINNTRLFHLFVFLWWCRVMICWKGSTLSVCDGFFFLSFCLWCGAAAQSEIVKTGLHHYVLWAVGGWALFRCRRINKWH